MSLIRFCLVVTGVVVILGSCRTVQSTDTKDLGNFARKQGVAVKHHVCRADTPAENEHWYGQFFAQATQQQRNQTKESDLKDPMIFIDAGSQKNDEIVATTLRNALNAIPINLQLAFFTTGGRIVADRNFYQVCGGAVQQYEVYARTFVTEGQTDINKFDDIEFILGSQTQGSPVQQELKKSLQACWVYVDPVEKGRPKGRGWIEIHINPEVSQDENGRLRALAVEHGTVRIFGYVLGQLLAHLHLNNSGENVGADGLINSVIKNDNITFKNNEKFVKEVQTIMKTVREDVRALPSDDDYDLFHYQVYLKEFDRLEQIRETKGPNSAEFRNQMAIYNKLIVGVNQLAFADAFDSYYCNEETRNLMKTKFPLTHARFERTNNKGEQEGLVAELEEIRVDTSDIKQGKNDVSTEFLLAANAAGIQGLYAQLLRLKSQEGTLVAFRGFLRRVFGLFVGIGRFLVNSIRYIGRLVVRGVSAVVRGVLWAGRVVVQASQAALLFAGRVAVGASRRLVNWLRSVRNIGPFRADVVDATCYFIRDGRVGRTLPKK